MRVLTAAQMKAAEKAAAEAGTSYEQLMENAGGQSAAAMRALAAEEGLAASALFLCGKGNNAGDAFVAARLLAGQGWACAVLPLCGNEYSTLAKRNLLRLPAEVRQLAEYPAGESFGFVVDGVFGTGFRGTLPQNVQDAFRAANSQSTLRIALDIPSGLNCDTGGVAPATFHAAHTLTFGALKPGLLVLGNKAYTGEVQVLDIGL